MRGRVRGWWPMAVAVLLLVAALLLLYVVWRSPHRTDLATYGAFALPVAIPLRAFGAHTPLPGPSASDLFVDPRQITELLSGSGWEDVRVGSVNEPAWIGSDVKDVMSYIHGMPVIRTLTASLHPMLAARVLAAIEEQYDARQRPDGIWVHAAAWLVTARRA